MDRPLIFATFVSALVSFAFSCERACGQQATHMRLTRPAAAINLPGEGSADNAESYPAAAPDGRGVPSSTTTFRTSAPNPKFSLGAEQKNLGFPDLDVGLFSKEVELPVVPISISLLANYNLELIVDQSMSMHTPDCPGFTSRWQWCGAQAHDLATQLAPYAREGLTITAFARTYQVYPHASAQNIADLFDHPQFGMGTRLAEPLADRLGAYFASRRAGSKPTLIAVITDGVPVPQFEPPMVVETLLKATKKVKDPHEVTVVFFQIGGGDRKGRYFLQKLDNNLVNLGARYDIVQTVPFERLEQIGLAAALVESIKDFAGENRPLVGRPRPNNP